jgi:hypothetical protein
MVVHYSLVRDLATWPLLQPLRTRLFTTQRSFATPSVHNRVRANEFEHES